MPITVRHDIPGFAAAAAAYAGGAVDRKRWAADYGLKRAALGQRAQQAEKERDLRERMADQAADLRREEAERSREFAAEQAAVGEERVRERMVMGETQREVAMLNQEETRRRQADEAMDRQKQMERDAFSTQQERELQEYEANQQKIQDALRGGTINEQEAEYAQKALEFQHAGVAPYKGMQKQAPWRTDPEKWILQNTVEVDGVRYAIDPETGKYEPDKAWLKQQDVEKERIKANLDIEKEREKVEQGRLEKEEKERKVAADARLKMQQKIYDDQMADYKKAALDIEGPKVQKPSWEAAGWAADYRLGNLPATGRYVEPPGAQEGQGDPMMQAVEEAIRYGIKHGPETVTPPAVAERAANIESKLAAMPDADASAWQVRWSELREEYEAAKAEGDSARMREIQNQLREHVGQ